MVRKTKAITCTLIKVLFSTRGFILKGPIHHYNCCFKPTTFRSCFISQISVKSTLSFMPKRKMASFMGENLNEELLVKKLTENAILPVRGSEDAAGFDLASAYDTLVPARGKALVKTDLAIAVPRNTYARIAPRSGLAWKKFIDVGAGVVDYDYRGNVGVVLFNHGEDDLTIAKGDRVAQLVLERISMAPLREVAELPDTARGAGGFGSTGVATSGYVESEQKEEEVDANGNKVRIISGTEVEGGKLLVFLNSLSVSANHPCWSSGGGEAFSSYEDAKQKLKPLALNNDPRLDAAMQAYKATDDLEDLIDTLSLLIMP